MNLSRTKLTQFVYRAGLTTTGCATTTLPFCAAGSITVTDAALVTGAGTLTVVTCAAGTVVVVVKVAVVAACLCFFLLCMWQYRQPPIAQGTIVQKSAQTPPTMGPIKK